MDGIAGVYTDPFTSLNSKKKDSADVLSKREYFAAYALQGILSNPKSLESRPEPQEIIDLALFYADGLILRLGA